MSHYEYRVVAAPTRGVKGKGLRSAEARFSNALEQLMNAQASAGWEYQRAETLPSVERKGFTSTTTQNRSVLVFRRLKPADPAVVPAASNGANATESQPAGRAPPPIVAPQHPEDDASQSEGATRMPRDNGVEDLSEVSGLTNSLTQLAASRKASKPDS